MQEQNSPVICVYTFGKFRVERLERVLAGQTPAFQYVPVSNTVWGKRNDGRKLLKVLVCSDYRRAPRDVLLELLWPDAEKRHADRYLNSAASSLRRVLCTPTGETLLRTVRPDRNMTLYELADQHDIWLDVDAFLDLFAQAEQAGQAGRDPLPLLEQAQRLACGEFLVEHLYHAWADHLRQSVNAARHRCIYQLATLYEQRHLFEQAEALLYNVLKQDPTDEDVLCRLMQALARQGKPAEALACYERSRRALDKDLQAQPLASTQALARRLRTETALAEQAARKRPPDPHTLASAESVQAKPIPQEHAVASLALPLYYANDTMNRREAGKKIVTIGASLLTTTHLFDLMQVGTMLHDEEILSVCATYIPIFWRLYFDGYIVEVKSVLPEYFSHLSALASQPSPHQKQAASLASKASQLACMLALHDQKFGDAFISARQGFQYGQLAEDSHLQVASLIRKALVYFYLKKPEQKLRTYQEAQLHEAHLSPLVRARIYMGLSEAHSNLVALGDKEQEQEALHFLELSYKTIPVSPKEDPHFSYTHFGLPQGYESLLYLDLQQPQKAWDILTAQSKNIPVAIVPDRVTLWIRQTRTLIALGNMEESCAYLESSIAAARTLNSPLYLEETWGVYQQLCAKWPNEQQARELTDLFLA